MLLLWLLLAGPLVQDDATGGACWADARWLPSNSRTVNRSVEQHPFSLFTAVGGPPSCSPASIRLTVAYFASDGSILCSGVLDNVAPLREETQVTSLLFNVANHFELVRWRNGPREIAVRPLPLACVNADGIAETQPSELARAASMRILATVVAGQQGSSATAELDLTLRN